MRCLLLGGDRKLTGPGPRDGVRFFSWGAVAKLPTMWFISSPGSICSTCTSALGYRPAPWCERIVSVVGDLRFQSAIGPVISAACLMTITLPRRVPALERPVAHRVCFALEPESNEDHRDYTFECAVRVVVSASTTLRHVTSAREFAVAT